MVFDILWEQEYIYNNKIRLVPQKEKIRFESNVKYNFRSIYIFIKKVININSKSLLINASKKAGEIVKEYLSPQCKISDNHIFCYYLKF